MSIDSSLRYVMLFIYIKSPRLSHVRMGPKLQRPSMAQERDDRANLTRAADVSKKIISTACQFLRTLVAFD